MAPPLLLCITGTRAGVLTMAPILRAAEAPPGHADGPPWDVRLIVAGRERTELDQTLGALEIEPEADLDVLRPYLADACLDATLIDAVEEAVRHRPRTGAILVAGAGPSAWAAAMVAAFKDIALARIESGDEPLPGQRPMPEWLHLADIRRLAALHLCADKTAADLLRSPSPDAALGDLPPEAQVEIAGDLRLDALAHSLDRAQSLDDDPSLAALRPDAPRGVVYIKRREHHANGLRPVCQALAQAAQRFPHTDFLVFYSLQSHVCDALRSLLPQAPNIHLALPLPHPAFVRELARARLVMTDSAGIATEALYLRRPVVIAGRYSATRRLEPLARELAATLHIADMQADDLIAGIEAILAQDAPAPHADLPHNPAAGARILEILTAWRKMHDRAGEPG